MNFNPKKIEFPSNKIIETKEAIKSKANFLLKEKIRGFYLFLEGINYLNIQNIDLLEDDSLENYIKYLNDKKIYIEQKREKSQQQFNEAADKVSSENEMRELLEKADKKKKKYDDKSNLIDRKLDEAQVLREEKDTAEIDLDDNLLPFDNKVDIESQNINAPITDQIAPDIELPMVDSIEKIENTNNEINEQNNELDESENVEVKKEEKSPAELMYEKYIEKVENIKNVCKKNIDEKVEELLIELKKEADEVTRMQLLEISNVAKASINQANSNLERIKEEKTEVENERDQYKSHYEQTLDVVSEKEKIIEAKDNEITSLNSTIDSKNNELTAANEREAELKTIIEKQKEVISIREKEIENNKIAISTIMRTKYEEAKDNELSLENASVDLSQSIELDENLGETIKSK